MTFLPAIAIRAATPQIFLENAVLNGAGDTVVISRVPVMDSAGTITYQNISLIFRVDNAGILSLDQGSPVITFSPAIAIGAFQPGVYKGSVATDILYDVGSPAILPGGRISASLNSRPTSCSDHLNIGWVTGPIMGHPNEIALNTAQITSTAYSWGTVGIQNGCWPDTYPGWNDGDIVGVVQTGDQISVHNLGHTNVEKSVLVFTLCPTCH
jgi:hypothetical protein